MEGSLKQKMVKGIFWTLSEKLSVQAVNFVVGIVLARLLTPTDYGTVALTGIFFALAGALADSGFGEALIQKKDADDIDFNSVFYLSLGLSALAYGALYLVAPLIADFYGTPVLVPIVRVSALLLVFNAFNGIQNAELMRKMLFHLSFRISLIISLSFAVCGITLAALGYGVWALVWAGLVSEFLGVVARWFVIAWRPRFLFSIARLRPLFAYGWKMAATAFIGSLFSNLSGLLIGRCYTRADLAFVEKGNALPRLALNQVTDSIGRVAFPAFAQMQDDPSVLREAMRRVMRCTTFLVFPMMVGIAACAKSELLLLYGSQWLSAEPYMQLACILFASWAVHTVHLRGMMALGRSDVVLKLEIVKRTLYLVCVALFFRQGVFVFVAASVLAAGPMSIAINAWPNRRLMGYTLRMQLADILPTMAVCVALAAVVFGVDRVFNSLGFGFATTGTVFSLIEVLALQFVLGAATYFVVSYVFRLKPMIDCLEILKEVCA